MELTIVFCSVILRYSSAVPPALRTVKMVSFSMCVPSQHILKSVGVALSMYLVIVRSCSWTLPAPPPPPMPAEPDCDAPQLHDKTSISPLCLLSVDSPLMSPILMNMSTAIAHSFGKRRRLTPAPWVEERWSKVDPPSCS